MSQRGFKRNSGGSQGYRGRGGGWWRGRSSNRGYGRGRPSNSQPSKPKAVQTTLYDVPSPYKGWKLYFPEEIYSDSSDIVQRVKHFERYFIEKRQTYNRDEIERELYFVVDLKDVLADTGIIQAIPELSTEIRKNPDILLNVIGLAMHQTLTKELVEDHPESAILPKIHCRLSKFEPVTALKNLKANYYGKFVSIKGTVVRVSNIKPLCTKLTFECNSCFTLQVMTLPDGKFVQPSSCPGAECRSKSFAPKRSHSKTVTIDWQSIRVQEIINDDHRESGRIPRTVDCELMNDLVDCCVPGDQVVVSGVVKVQSSQEGGGRQKDKCMFLLYIEANYVHNTKGSKTQGQVATGITMEFTMKDLYAIEEIQAEESLFRLLVQSLCPAIYGHEMVKAGLLLGLLGGTHKYVNDKNRIPVRGDPHILVVGDPGLGKSQMLQAVANVAPRSVYVCGNTTTTSGLTVTLSREGGGSGDYALEAGALVLADQGCCCIDEFDKMGSQHQALLEAMEQQSISIAKAGIVCSLPARTSILAAANPVGGHYNKAKTVSENLRLGSALLSRFDLVFILLDKPDEEMDALLSEHVMAMHTGKPHSGTTPSLSSSLTQEESEARKQWEAQKLLSERLKVDRSQPPLDLIPPPLLRKYVAYARKYVHPKITPEAAQVLQQFYLDLRRQHQTRDSTPITTRQLESLIRLTEARARVDLREECGRADAEDVVELMKYSMLDTYSDELGFLDFTRSQHGSGMSSRSHSKKFVAALQKVYDQTYNALFTMQELRQIAQQANVKVRDFEEFIASLNNQGFLLKKGARVYQLQTAGY